MLSLIAVLGFERTTYSVKEGEDLVFPFGMYVKGDIEEAENSTGKRVILEYFRGRVTTDLPGTLTPEHSSKSL